MSKLNFWRRLADHIQGDERAVVAVVADHTRHSPGTRGARMFVKPNGLQVGTIGGGAMEADILERSIVALRDADLRIDRETLEHRRDPAAGNSPSGLICAGKQTMVYFVVGPDDFRVLSEFAHAGAADREVALRVTLDGIDLVERAVEDGQPPVRLIGDADDFEYVEHAVSHKRVAVIGGGHCGLAMSKTMSDLGYHVSLFETRGDVFTLQQNEWADEVHVVDDYVEAGPLVSFPELTHFVVMTADYPSDVRALLGGIELPFPYKGVMGSEAKLRAIRADLLEHGIEESSINELYAPIGLSMTSNTPPEIAISVAAQILREREKLFPWTAPSPG